MNRDTKKAPEPSDRVIIKLNDISKNFGGVTALRKVNLTIYHGERHAIIGPNGAGKTTLFNVVSGEISPDEGSIILFDQPLNHKPTRARIRMGLGRTYQITNLFPEMTVEENIFLAVAGSLKKPMNLLREWKKEEGKCKSALQILNQIGFEQYLTTQVGQLSYGDQRKLDLALAIAGNPRILLLDEPMAGLSRNDRLQMADFIKGLNPDYALIIIEHDIEMAFGIVDRVTVFHMGAIIAQGSPDEIRSNEEVKKLYMRGTK